MRVLDGAPRFERSLGEVACPHVAPGGGAARTFDIDLPLDTIGWHSTSDEAVTAALLGERAYRDGVMLAQQSGD